MNKVSRTAAALASSAALMLAATPALARDYNGWGGGWGGWGRHHHDRVDAGDVLAGVLIIGGITAIASAASKASKERRDRPEYRYPDQSRPEQDRGYEGADRNPSGTDNRPDWSESGGLNAAVDRCASEVERGDRRIETIESVNRADNGWRVAGHMDGGRDFS